ncbi:TIGR02281 family clan AA aspartic protease [Aquicoccus porphyridii]|uniref:TIGR02281 family clan AA aspartic protease n=1 Tax=Aquicoccus porphyridii TaxID=1852029 RepID=A0A5A9ZJR2_9RHOB|nr:TIGR02281 family clan AA aspartic protease [Aquicoccus porphyridii]KAA0917553.1 TIGR02281 family clan AA aspartic protease [Aquicoccus porphyridii]RAI55633.1 TIGR02281 family clan AA aspartic protease [Rhodobacteraceae bacterium AsT-22]
MSNDPATLTYLVLLLSAIAVWFFVHNRERLGKLVQQALAWGLIFAGALAVVALWDDIRQAVTPQQSVIAEQGVITLPRARDGHYYVTAEVNGTPIRFTVDTGATEIVLSRQDALSAGIDTESLAYVGRAYTANGEVRTAPVRLDSISIGAIRDDRVMAYVNDGDMSGSLLGMRYLNRYSRIEITDGALTLTR